MLDVEQNAGALSFSRQPGCQSGILQDGGEIIKPIDVAGRHIETKEIMVEPMVGRGFEIVERRREFSGGKGALAPALPREVSFPAIRLDIIDMEYAPVEGPLLHLRNVLSQKGSIRLIPAELD